jgi:glycosyltransferase involved in cell wall biosynthesis
MLDRITPVILTYNEEQNIARTLAQLGWAKDIVVVDSGSTDETLRILANFPSVRLFSRRFVSHAGQWLFAITETQIRTDWILRLDADYQVGAALITELANLHPNPNISAFRIGFDYAVYSHKLMSSLYPANTILFRKDRFSVWQSGHTEKWGIIGSIATLKSRIVHDDWKPIQQWLVSQERYMQREFHKLRGRSGPGLQSWMRVRPPLMPIAVFFYCLFVKGLIFNGRAGIFYALQRMVAEALLSLILLEDYLRQSATSTADPPQENESQV